MEFASHFTRDNGRIIATEYAISVFRNKSLVARCKKLVTTIQTGAKTYCKWNFTLNYIDI